MSINDILTFLAQVLFVTLSAVAILDYIRFPNPRRRDFALLCSSLGFPLGVTLVRNIFGIESLTLNLLGAFILFAQPYFLFRLLHYYRPSRLWSHILILLGTVGCWVLIYFYIAKNPVVTQVVIFGYCVVVDAYCTWAYSQGVRQSTGILRRRLLLLTISAGLFTLALAGNAIKPLLPDLAQNISAVGLAVTAISAILYYLIFIPPRWLRHAWQFEELRDFLTRTSLVEGKVVNVPECYRQLYSAALQSTNGTMSAVVQWDDATNEWAILGSSDPALTTLALQQGSSLVKKAWQQRQPVALYVPTLQQLDERRRIETVGARTWLIVPILALEHVWGLLIVLLRDRSLFIDDDLAQLELFAQQCAILLENNRLIAELQSHSEQLERKVEERTTELRESEGRFRNLADSAPVMIWMTDGAGTPLYFNQQWYDFTGVPSATAARASGTDGANHAFAHKGERNWFDAVVHPEDAQMAQQTFTQGHKQRQSFQQEYRLCRHDGVYRWLLDSAIPRLDENGEVIGYIGSILDITEHKDSEQRLQVIHQLSEAVNRAEAVEQIYDLALSGLDRVLQVHRAAILLFDHKGTLHLHAWRDISEAYRAAIDERSPQIINELDPKSVFIPDVAAADLGSLKQATLDEGIHAIGYIPLVEQKRLLGKFIIYYDQPHPFSEAEIQWAQTIARHVAYALQRKQSEVKFQTYTHTLEEFNHIQISLAVDLDIQELLQMVVDVATELSGAQFGLFFYKGETTQIGAQAHEGASEDGSEASEYADAESIEEAHTEEDFTKKDNVEQDTEWSMTRYTLSGVPEAAVDYFAQLGPGELFGPNFTSGTVIRLADVTKDTRHPAHAFAHGPLSNLLPICSYLAVPVVTRAGELIGGLFFGHSKPDIFTDQAEQLVGGIASQAAITIENAQLYAQIRERELALREFNATLEQRVEQRTEELQRSNKELDQFAYVASHDLKAPLRAITHLANWIEQDTAELLPQSTQEHLQKLKGRVQRMESLLNDLLTYSRVGRQRHPSEEVDIAEIIDNVTHTLALPEGFTIKPCGEMPVMKTERTPLETVFRNLIDNAIKHHHHAANGSVEIWAKEQGPFVEFSVKDDGPGIAPEFHHRIFEIFQTLQPRDKVEGSGIGLAVVKKSVENRGGTIEVESAQGEGTTFRFTWPRNGHA